MRVLVCGGREFSDMLKMTSVLFRPVRDKEYTHLICGGAAGADSLAIKFAEICSIPITVYYANWLEQGKSAGPKRNQKMLDEGKPDLVIAFPGGRGTADMVRRAEKAGIKVIKVT